MSIERYDRSQRPVVRGPVGPMAAVKKVKRGPDRKAMPKQTKVHFKDDTIIEPPIGTVIKISGELRGSYGVGEGRRYDYAAIRAGNGRWYTTGATCPTFGYNWPEFLRFLQGFIDPTGERLC